MVVILTPIVLRVVGIPGYINKQDQTYQTYTFSYHLLKDIWYLGRFGVWREGFPVPKSTSKNFDSRKNTTTKTLDSSQVSCFCFLPEGEHCLFFLLHQWDPFHYFTENWTCPLEDVHFLSVLFRLCFFFFPRVFVCQ